MGLPLPFAGQMHTSEFAVEGQGSRIEDASSALHTMHTLHSSGTLVKHVGSCVVVREDEGEGEGFGHPGAPGLWIHHFSLGFWSSTVSSWDFFSLYSGLFEWLWFTCFLLRLFSPLFLSSPLSATMAIVGVIDPVCLPV